MNTTQEGVKGSVGYPRGNKGSESQQEVTSTIGDDIGIAGE